MSNPLVSDRDVSFLLYELLDAGALTELAAFREHSRETFDLYVDACRRLARDVLFPAYRPLDEAPPHLSGSRVLAHPLMFLTEVPRVAHLLDLCRKGEDSYARIRPDWF